MRLFRYLPPFTCLSLVTTIPMSRIQPIAANMDWLHPLKSKQLLNIKRAGLSLVTS